MNERKDIYVVFVFARGKFTKSKKEDKKEYWKVKN